MRQAATGRFIETFTGATVNPLKPVWADIRIEDIAHGLSNECRFNGQCRFFYSVAEHSVRVSELLESEECSEQESLWGLLHDASEAFLKDLPRPLKCDPELGPLYDKCERRLMRAICLKFSLPMVQPLVVTSADQCLLATEVRDLMHGDRPYWKKIKAEPLTNRISPWSPAVAEYEFLRRFKQLGGV